MATAPNILIVDDEYDIVSALELALQLEGFAVRTAFHGGEALATLKAGWRPDLILSDLMMPVMDGYQFVHALQADPDLRGLPVVLMSAAQLSAFEMPAGSWRLFVRKPFDLYELIDSLRKVMAS